MKLAETPIARRLFLKAAVPCFALTVGSVVRSQTLIERGQFGEVDLGSGRAQLLDLANSERTLAGAARLELDDLACKVANEHALDMVKGDFLSHWGSDGLKPYHRYSFAGGSDASEENVSAAANIASRRVSEKQGMRVVVTDERDYVSGRMAAEIWEITAEEWNQRRSRHESG